MQIIGLRELSDGRLCPLSCRQRGVCPFLHRRGRRFEEYEMVVEEKKMFACYFQASTLLLLTAE